MYLVLFKSLSLTKLTTNSTYTIIDYMKEYWNFQLK